MRSPSSPGWTDAGCGPPAGRWCLILAECRHELAPFARIETARLLVDVLAGDHALHRREPGLRQVGAAHAVFHEGVVADRRPALQRVDHDVGIDADLVL